MAKTVGEAIRDVRVKLGEDTESRWRDRDLRVWLNEGQRELARRFKWYRRTGSISAVAGTQTYTLPSDALVITDPVVFTPTGTTLDYPMWYRDQRNIRAQTYTWFQTSEAVPAVWWTEGYPGTSTFTLGVYPTPAQTGTFKVPYYGIPADIPVETTAGSSTSIAVPEGYESLLVMFVVYQAWLSDGDPRWEQQKAMYEAELESFEAATVRFAEAAGEINPSAGIFGDMFDEEWV